MKALVIIAILLAIGLILLLYKRDQDTQKLLISGAILGWIITSAILGNVMRSIMPLFLTHIGALVVAYGGLMLYILQRRNYWFLWGLPLVTLLLYLLLAWVGNEHLPL